MRKEHDFLGELEIPDNAYYGVQTMRAMENFQDYRLYCRSAFYQSLGYGQKGCGLGQYENRSFG